MAGSLILQSPILTKFVYPFFLIFFILFAIIDRTKIFGEEKKTINALVSFVISFIFVSAIFPKEIVTNLVLFLTIAIVIVFIVLLLWGFIMGGDGLKIFESSSTGFKIFIGILIVIAVTIAVIWAAGIDTQGLIGKLFNSDWSESFWTNVLFIVLVAIALAVVLKSGGQK
ncbi:MAG: hypothetical protein ABIE36_02675 [Candidatus Diapherotrites archaeon]